MGEAVIQCHGVNLLPFEAEAADEHHPISVDRIEDEYYVRINHEMTKEHYISFIAALSSDEVKIIKLYSEGSSEARFKIKGIKKIVFFCNRDGLFTSDIRKDR